MEIGRSLGLGLVWGTGTGALYITLAGMVSAAWYHDGDPAGHLRRAVLVGPLVGGVVGLVLGAVVGVWVGIVMLITRRLRGVGSARRARGTALLAVAALGLPIVALSLPVVNAEATVALVYAPLVIAAGLGWWHGPAIAG